jgi:hypothetical protein
MLEIAPKSIPTQIATAPTLNLHNADTGNLMDAKVAWPAQVEKRPSRWKG